jgi:hypothetical protein
MPSDPRQVAYDTVDKILKKGLAQGHKDEGWRDYPQAMHIQKGIRHGVTTLLLQEHPVHCIDKETAREHLENAITRYVMALTQDG